MGLLDVVVWHVVSLRVSRSRVFVWFCIRVDYYLAAFTQEQVLACSIIMSCHAVAVRTRASWK